MQVHISDHIRNTNSKQTKNYRILDPERAKKGLQLSFDKNTVVVRVLKYIWNEMYLQLNKFFCTCAQLYKAGINEIVKFKK